MLSTLYCLCFKQFINDYSLDGCFIDGCFLDACWTAALQMAAYFEQVKKQPYNKTPLGETGCLNNFLGYLSMSRALHRGFSDLKRSPSALSTTPTAFGCLLLLIVPAPSFLIHPPFPNTVVQGTLGYLPLTVQCLCDLQDAMPCKRSPSQLLSRDAKDFSRGCNHSKHMPLLIYLQSFIKYLRLTLVFM